MRFIVGIATTATTDVLADGAGIQIPDNTLKYEHSNTALKSGENLNLQQIKLIKLMELMFFLQRHLEVVLVILH